MHRQYKILPIPFRTDEPEGPPTLFLDLDGVLHPDNVAGFQKVGPPSGNTFCWNLRFVEMMKMFPTVQVVLHSTWRLLWDTDEELFSYLPASLNELLQGRTTGRVCNGRWESIYDYCYIHNIKKYVIVDDMRNAFPYELEELVWCKPDKGISDSATMYKLINHLKGIA